MLLYFWLSVALLLTLSLTQSIISPYFPLPSQRHRPREQPPHLSERASKCSWECEWISFFECFQFIWRSCLPDFWLISGCRAYDFRCRMAKQLVRTTTNLITSRSPNMYVGYGLCELPIQTVVQDRTAFNSMANCVYEESQLNACRPSQVSNEAFLGSL